MLKFFSTSLFGIGPESMREEMRLLFFSASSSYNALLFLLLLFHPATLSSPYPRDFPGVLEYWGRLVDRFEGKNHSHDLREFLGHYFV